MNRTIRQREIDTAKAAIKLHGHFEFKYDDERCFLEQHDADNSTCPYHDGEYYVHNIGSGINSQFFATVEDACETIARGELSWIDDIY